MKQTKSFTTISTVTELRKRFWEEHPKLKYWYKEGQRQNDYNAEIRQAWVYYIDTCERDGIISNELADRAVL